MSVYQTMFVSQVSLEKPHRAEAYDEYYERSRIDMAAAWGKGAYPGIDNLERILFHGIN